MREGKSRVVGAGKVFADIQGGGLLLEAHCATTKAKRISISEEID